MADQAALQEAIQRARQLAAKMAPTKRPASEMEDHSLGTVKVTLAYEKTPNSDKTDQHRSRDNNYNKDPIQSTRDRERDRSRDRDSVYSGGNGNNTSYSGAPTSGERIEIIIPHAVIGLVIGKGGENIKRIQNETRATVRVDPNTIDEKGNKVCTITGSKQAVEDAHNQVASVIENAATNKRPRMNIEGSEQYRMKIPASRTGAIIGKGGDTIKSIKQNSGCDIELDKNTGNPDESVFIIRGTQDKIMKARALIEARLTRSNPIPKGVATGANATPVVGAPSAECYQAPQQSADMSAAWAAYFAQYSNLINQTGAQAGVQPGVQPGVPTGTQPATQPAAQPATIQPSAAGSQQDYSDQWIEYYNQNGRPDYAEQIIQMKKQQQQQNK